eukprot:NODE_11895_length_456_cov_0.753799_g11872_i0.p1 GENE.NODE_11895_length_456_cov_0.753799_g11872_i0~~NODE_11895_length_456_cov_0.753799_g11872_i0.p1  ORF type:complete len:126 (+),score=13.05 NODE_11895_length_456_cov_0.753799_g11872_i0:41-418(+)
MQGEPPEQSRNFLVLLGHGMEYHRCMPRRAQALTREAQAARATGDITGIRAISDTNDMLTGTAVVNDMMVVLPAGTVVRPIFRAVAIRGVPTVGESPLSAWPPESLLSAREGLSNRVPRALGAAN